MDPYQFLSWKNAAAVLAFYCVGLTFYRLFLHPLAKFPGPKLAAITRWYEAYYDLFLEGQYTFKIAEMHKTYGPIIRISPYELHIIDPAFYEKLYCQDGMNKYEWACKGFIANGATICTSLHELHRARRLPLDHFFSKAKVAARQDVVIRNVDKLCSAILHRVGSTINLGAAAGALVQDVQCDFILDKAYGSLEKEDFNVAVADMCQNVGFFWRFTKHFPRLGSVLKAIPTDWVSKVANENARIFFAFLKGIDKDTERLLNSAASSTDKESTHTVVHEIVSSKLPPADKSLPRVLNEVQTIVGAGLETVSGVLRLMLYHVFSNAEVLQRLRTELATVSTASSLDDLMDLKKLEQLPYLTSIIMESLRMSPAIGSRMARVVSDKELLYGGWSIPAGTPVGMTTILMHTDETLYPEPFSFNPDRWMDIEKRRTSGKIYAPFSRGTRMCAGMYLAWADLYFALAALAPRFNFEFQDVQSSDFRMVRDEFVIGTKSKSLLKCRVTLRGA